MATFALAFLLVCVCDKVWAQNSDLYDNIYRPISIQHNSFCWRLLNDGGEVGCQSRRTGTGAVAYFIGDDEALQRYLALGEGGDGYAVVVESGVLTGNTFRQLVNADYTKSVMVLKGVSSAGFSPARKSPNALKGLYHDNPAKQHVWNPDGNEENFSNTNKPMVLVENDADIDYIKKAAAANFGNQGELKSYPLFALELNEWMTGALDATTCLRRGLCDPLGNWNVMGSIRRLTNGENFVMGVAGLDSTSLFKSRAYGAATTVASFAVLLAAAETLGKIPKENQAPMNIVFYFFNGESYDYIGSSRFAKDLEKGVFPGSNDARVGAENIKAVVEVGQVGVRGSSASPKPLFVHSDAVGAADAATQRLAEQVIESGRQTGTVIQKATNQLLPPASLQTLLRRVSREMVGVVVADHDSDQFANRFYQSFMDGPDNIGLNDPIAMDNLCKVSTTVARALFSAAGGLQETALTIAANCTNLQSLLQATVTGMNTQYMQELYRGTECATAIKEYNSPLPLYVGVLNRNGPPCVSSSYMTYLHLARSLGEYYDDKTAQCPDMNQGLVVTGSKCVNASVNITAAWSPGLTSDEVLDNSYSTWTESRWEGGVPNGRTYSQSSSSEDLSTLISGICVLLLSFLATILGMRHFKRNFKQD